MSLAIPCDLLTEIEKPKIKALSYKVLTIPFDHYLIEDKHTQTTLTFLGEGVDGRARSFTVQVVTEIFKLARNISSNADLCAILAVVTSLYNVNPDYSQRLLSYYRSLASRSFTK